MSDNPYSFKSCKLATNATIHEQIVKVQEEAAEILAAETGDEDDEDIIDECWDAIWAIEGVLRKFDVDKVIKGKTRVIKKNKSRNYL